MLVILVLLSQILCISKIKVCGIINVLNINTFKYNGIIGTITDKYKRLNYSVEHFKHFSDEKNKNLKYLKFMINNDIWIFEDAEINVLDCIQSNDILKKWTFKDPKINVLDCIQSNDILKKWVLNDGSELTFNDTCLNLSLKKNKNVMVYDVKEVKEEDFLVFEFINGQKMIINDVESYINIEDNVYMVNLTNNNPRYMCLLS